MNSPNLIIIFKLKFTVVCNTISHHLWVGALYVYFTNIKRHSVKIIAINVSILRYICMISTPLSKVGFTWTNVPCILAVNSSVVIWDLGSICHDTGTVTVTQRQISDLFYRCQFNFSMLQSVLNINIII